MNVTSASSELLKVVFDTNIYVMAANMPGGYIDYWLRQAGSSTRLFQLYVSPAILAEIQTKLETKFDFSRALAVQYVSDLQIIAKVINPTQKLNVVKRDPDDNKILECAAEAGAQLIVSADRDLIKLKRYQKTGIIHPTDLKYVFPKIISNDS